MGDDQEKVLTDNQERILLAEYDNAHSTFQHYDSFRWQSGSILIAAAVVLWGLLFSRNTAPSVLEVSIAGVFVSLMLSCWLLYAFHYRQLYMTKMYRIHQIERRLGMNLNSQLGFLGHRKSDLRIYGPKGHNIDIAVFVLTSLFGPAYKILELREKAEITRRSTLLLLLPLTITAVAIIFVRVNEKKMQRWYKSNPC
jgi:4-amino-4-deoxy-L-arabinose transferase-like glycosyltransferase